MNNFKLYIARDEGKWDEDVQTTGELNLFYDTPELLFNVEDWTSYWGNARKIANIPSYMYPQEQDNPDPIATSTTPSVLISVTIHQGCYKIGV